jgi:hypothetical protein
MTDAEKRLLLQDLEENPILELQEEFSSCHKINKVVKTDPAFKYLEPQEHRVIVNPKTCSEQQKEFSFVYVSVPETLKNVVESLGAKAAPLNRDHMLRDVKDGLKYKTNNFFKKHPEAYTLMFYSDTIEITNPLGAKKGVYKIVNVYWTIAEIPKQLRQGSTV